MHNKKLSIVIPCYNEESSLKICLERVFKALSNFIELEIIIVDDYSKDDSYKIAQALATEHAQIKVFKHDVNQGKGAALRTGFKEATGDFVAVQDADLEYDPTDLRKLVTPLIDGYADVVLGSRFMSTQERRVLYYWHTLGNKFLTTLSNMFTDTNLSDMETCYKVFKREVIQAVDIEENRFGFEPEIVAKIAHQGYRIYEIGISYHGRTYAEGKKIGWRDGFRALYCIIHYNAHQIPGIVQFAMYFIIGGLSALCNLAFFSILIHSHFSITAAALAAFFGAAGVNYWLCIHFLFKHKAQWDSKQELLVYLLLACSVGIIDMEITRHLSAITHQPLHAKLIATACSFVLNFLGRKFIVFRKRKVQAEAQLNLNNMQ